MNNSCSISKSTKNFLYASLYESKLSSEELKVYCQPKDKSFGVLNPKYFKVFF